jgi:O-antigen/teichoic acid export membrane protein
MTRNIQRRDIVWGYCAQVLNIAGGMILLPVLVRCLSPQELGLWFVFLALASITQLLDFGILPTLSRNSAYIYAGAQELHKTGLNTEINIEGHLNVKLLADLLATARRIYRWVSLIAAAILLFCGTAYIHSLTPKGSSSVSILAGWFMFATGYIINFYYSYYNAFLQGRGDITQSNKVVTTSRSILIIVGGLLVLSGWGLIGLGVASLVSCVFSRILAHHYFYSNSREETLILKKKKGNPQRLASTLKTNTWRLGLVYLGSFLIIRANQLIASSFLGLSIAASYGLTMQIALTLSGVACTLSNIQLPSINALQIRNHRDKLIRVFGSALISAWVIYCTGSLPLILFGDAILSAIGSRTELLPTPMLVVFLAIGVLEMNHSIFATYLTSLNQIPFVYSALLSGLVIMGSSLILVNVTDLGLWSLIISQGAVQSVYNNWKWPYEALKHLRCNLIDLLKGGINELRLVLDERRL